MKNSYFTCPFGAAINRLGICVVRFAVRRMRCPVKNIVGGYVDYVAAIFGQQGRAYPVYSVRCFFIILGFVYSCICRAIYNRIVLIFFEKFFYGCFIWALPGFPWVADLLMSFPEGTNEGYGPIFSDSRADRALVC